MDAVEGTQQMQQRIDLGEVVHRVRTRFDSKGTVPCMITGVTYKHQWTL